MAAISCLSAISCSTFSAMLIANCTGVAHIAAAVKTQSVIISMNGEPERWAPLNKNLHCVIDWTKHRHFESVFDAVVEKTKAENTILHN
jgi:ADP-heptose:LPS heptosyltransferase